MLNQYLEHFRNTIDEVMGRFTYVFHLNLWFDTTFDQPLCIEFMNGKICIWKFWQIMLYYRTWD